MDRINMNVFRQMKNEKRGLPTNKKEIFAKPKPKNPGKKYTRPTGQYTLGMGQGPQNDPYAFEQLPDSAGANEEQGMDLYYANPNNYQMDNTNMQLQTKTNFMFAPSAVLKELNNLFFELTRNNCNLKCKNCYIQRTTYKEVNDYLKIAQEF